jgi:hypothetical protein
VRKIAIKTPSVGSLTLNDYTDTLSDVLSMFGGLEELLVVEEKVYQKLVGNGDRLAGLLKDHRKNCMVEGFEVFDCDAADVLAYELPAGEMVDGGHLRSMETHCMLNEGENWKECEYFEKIAKGLEEKLSRDRDEKAGKGNIWWEVPRVRSVVLATRDMAHELLELRKRYWERCRGSDSCQERVKEIENMLRSLPDYEPREGFKEGKYRGRMTSCERYIVRGEKAIWQPVA